MAFIEYLKISGEALPLPTSLDIELKTIEADTTGETEAGTLQRDVVREGVVKIDVTFAVSPKWLRKLSEYAKEHCLTVSYFDTLELKNVEKQMYVEGFKATLKKDTSFKGLWTVSFSLCEF